MRSCMESLYYMYRPRIWLGVHGPHHQFWSGWLIYLWSPQYVQLGSRKKKCSLRVSKVFTAEVWGLKPLYPPSLHSVLHTFTVYDNNIVYLDCCTTVTSVCCPWLLLNKELSPCFILPKEECKQTENENPWLIPVPEISTYRPQWYEATLQNIPTFKLWTIWKFTFPLVWCI